MKYVFIVLILIFSIQTSFANAASGIIKEPVQIVLSTDEQNTENLKETVNSVLAQYLPEAKVLSIDEIERNGETLCVCRGSYQNTIFNLTINPKTGAISGKPEGAGEDTANNGANLAPNKAMVKLSTKQVNDILKDTMPGASIEKTRYDKKNGTVDGQILYKNLKYYFKINAITGEIIEMRPL